jgi:hypothetical protein
MDAGRKIGPSPDVDEPFVAGRDLARDERGGVPIARAVPAGGDEGALRDDVIGEVELVLPAGRVERAALTLDRAVRPRALEVVPVGVRVVPLRGNALDVRPFGCDPGRFLERLDPLVPVVQVPLRAGLPVEEEHPRVGHLAGVDQLREIVRALGHRALAGLVHRRRRQFPRVRDRALEEVRAGDLVGLLVARQDPAVGLVLVLERRPVTVRLVRCVGEGDGLAVPADPHDPLEPDIELVDDRAVVVRQDPVQRAEPELLRLVLGVGQHRNERIGDGPADRLPGLAALAPAVEPHGRFVVELSRCQPCGELGLAESLAERQVDPLEAALTLARVALRVDLVGPVDQRALLIVKRGSLAEQIARTEDEPVLDCLADTGSEGRPRLLFEGRDDERGH